VPTLALIPIATSTTAPKLVSLAQFESALIKSGYNKHPYSSIVRPGVEGASWDKENVWEVIYTYKDGYVRIEILDAPVAATRAQHMESKLVTLDSIFPAGFMSELRKANDVYNNSGPSIASGNCPHSWSYNDEWNTKEAQCNVSSSTIGGYPVAFALWYYQVTCPSQYDYCYFPTFPGQEFSGQTGMTFYAIEINLAP
jgi:hypothetical protein